MSRICKMAQPTFRATIYSRTKAIIVTVPDYNQNRSAPTVVREREEKSKIENVAI